jgi:hypothetical protein
MKVVIFKYVPVIKIIICFQHGGLLPEQRDLSQEYYCGTFSRQVSWALFITLSTVCK